MARPTCVSFEKLLARFSLKENREIDDLHIYHRFSKYWATKICWKQVQRTLYYVFPSLKKLSKNCLLPTYPFFQQKHLANELNFTAPGSLLRFRIGGLGICVFFDAFVHLWDVCIVASPKNYMTFLLFFCIPLEYQNLWSWKFWFLKTNNVIILVILVSGARYQDMNMSDLSQTCQYWIWNKTWNFHKRGIAYWPMQKKALASEHFVKAEIETFRPLNQDPHHRLFHITSLPPRKDMRSVETSEDKRFPST